MVASHELERLQHLLAELKRSGISLQRPEKTFMEVANIERNEIAISNVLGFLFDTEAEHGMGDLWIRALLEAAEEGAPGELSDWQLSPSATMTEVVTTNVAQNLRIDIVVETPSAVIGIENKIDASLYNDLPAYAGHLRNMANEPEESKAAVLVTLTKRDESYATNKRLKECQKQGVDLKNTTYARFLEKVKEHFGGYIDSADSDWITFSRDFMRTIDNQGERQMQFDSDLFQFTAENQDEICSMIEVLKEVTSMTKRQGESLQKRMIADEELLGMNIGKPAVYSPDKCYMYCSTWYNAPISETGGGWAHPQISNNISHMSIQCWVSSKRTKEKVKQALTDAGIDISNSEHEKHLVIKELPLDTEEEVLIEELKTLIRAILPIVDRERQ